MGHIESNVVATAAAGRFGITIDTTDGEYFGAGTLPTGYPDNHILAAQKAVELGSAAGFVRWNEQALNPLGTLWDVNGIHTHMVSEQWWTSPRSTEQVWLDWAERRFGAAAATGVVAAVQKSGSFLTNGVHAGKLPLMDHSGLARNSWSPSGTYNAYAIFARPGELLVTDSYENLKGGEFRPWQVDGRGVELSDFLARSTAASNAMQEALVSIRSVTNHLSASDADYLVTCFEDAALVVEAIRRTAVAARATDVYQENGGAANQQARDDACTAMEDWADHLEAVRGLYFRRLHPILYSTSYGGQTYVGYGFPIGLRAIAQDYRGI
jgi:hypothetical protein